MSNFDNLPQDIKDMITNNSLSASEKRAILRTAYINKEITDEQYQVAYHAAQATRFLREINMKTGASGVTTTSGEIASMEWNTTEVTTATYNVTDQDYTLYINDPSLFTNNTNIVINFTTFTAREGQPIIIVDNTGLVGMRNPVNNEIYNIRLVFPAANPPYGYTDLPPQTSYTLMSIGQTGQLVQYVNSAWSVIQPYNKPANTMNVDNIRLLYPFERGLNVYKIDTDITLNFLGVFPILKPFVVDPGRTLIIKSDQIMSYSDSVTYGGGIIWENPFSDPDTLFQLGEGSNLGIERMYLRNASTVGLPPAKLFSYDNSAVNGSVTIERSFIQAFDEVGEVRNAISYRDKKNFHESSSNATAGVTLTNVEKVEISDNNVEYNNTTNAQGFYKLASDTAPTDPNWLATFDNVRLTSTVPGSNNKLFTFSGGSAIYRGNIVIKGCSAPDDMFDLSNPGNINQFHPIVQLSNCVNTRPSYPSLVLQTFDESGTNQIPSTELVPQNVILGATSITDNDFFDFDSVAQEITTNVTGVYRVVVPLNMSRGVNAGTEAIVAQLQYQPNGGSWENFGQPRYKNLPNVNAADLYELVIEEILLNTGDKLRIRLETRDGTGALDIGLYYRDSATTGYNEIFPAGILIYRVG